ncbi:MAG TPA: PmeII family type II restriction endonuclease, partial [Candidatus Paceibacterota bacterium]
METLNKDEIKEYIRANIGEFHAKRLASFQSLKFEKILKRKNPYLFRAKGIDTAEELVSTIMEAHLSSQEETIFGDFLEGLAIFINSKVFGGKK